MQLKSSFTFLALTLFLTNCVYTQVEICQRAYVWPFVNELGVESKLAQRITDEVEFILTEFDCQILQRSNYSNLQAQIENEKAILSLENIPVLTQTDLDSTINAEVVIFGQVFEDISGNLVLRLSFENLFTKEILKSKILTLIGEEARIMSSRIPALKQRIKAILYPEAELKLKNLQEVNDWELAKSLNTLDAYLDYISKYHDGQFLAEARAGIVELRKKEESVKFVRIRNIYLSAIPRKADTCNTEIHFEGEIRVARGEGMIEYFFVNSEGDSTERNSFYIDEPSTIEVDYLWDISGSYSGFARLVVDNLARNTKRESNKANFKVNCVLTPPTISSPLHEQEIKVETFAKISFSWNPVPGAMKYGIEIQNTEFGKKTFALFPKPSDLESSTTSDTEYLSKVRDRRSSFDKGKFRWRVWAIDNQGNESPKSSWNIVRFKEI